MRNSVFLMMAALVASSACAEVLLYDTFADGSRGETDLPNESAVWVGYSSSGTGGVAMGTGSLAYTQSTSSQKLWTYFAPDGAPVSLEVGQQLRATVQLTPRGALYDGTSRNFRFGLFNDPTNAQVHSDTNDDGGGSGDPWTDSTGYGVQLALSAGPSGTDANVGKRTGLTNNSLMGSGGAWTFTHAGDPITALLDTQYTLTLELDYLAADQMQVTFAIADAAGVISTHSYLDTSDIYTNFDQLFFRFSSAAGAADVVDFNSFQIDYTVPEPATMALLGFGGLIAARRRR